MYDDETELLENDLISQYPIIQKLGIIPAILITKPFDSQSEEAAIAQVPWDAVIVTEQPPQEEEFFKKFKKASRKEIVQRTLDCEEMGKISKTQLSIYTPPGETNNTYWENDGANALEKIVELLFQNGGVIFINDVPECVYKEGLRGAVRRNQDKCRNSIYLIGLTENCAKKWQNEHYAVFMPVESAKCIGEFYSEEADWGNENTPQCHIYINGEMRSIEQSDVLQISQFGNLLTIEDLEIGTFLSKRDFPYAFRQFLDRSIGGTPDWYCYNHEIGFHLRRDIESDLLKDINNALEQADSSNRARPLLLCGQAYSGKTNVLCSLAYQIFSEHRYPVIYIPYSGDITDIKKYKELLAYLLGKIERSTQTIVPTLIVWDISCRQEKDLDLPLALLRYLRDEGRQVQMLCSSYDLCGNIKENYERKYITRKIEEILSKSEKQNLISLLQEKGCFTENEINVCINRFSNNPHFLASLYKFRELHENMEVHINRENAARNDELDKILEEITETSLGENLNNSLAILLEQINLGDNETPAATPDSGNRRTLLGDAISCIALCTFYGCSMPISLFLRLLSDNNWKLGPYSIYTALSNHTLLREQGDGDDLELVIRSPLEAKFMLNNVNRLDSLVKIVNKVNINNFNEIELIRKLVQSMGPNCKFVNKSDYSLWDDHWSEFEQVWEALKNLRENATEIWKIKLLPQELSLMREYSRNANKKKILEEAYQLAGEGKSKIKDTDDDLLKANILVEYCLLWQMMNEKIWQMMNEKKDTCILYNEIHSELRELAYRGNRHVQQTLLELGLKCYDEQRIREEGSIELLKQLYYWGSRFSNGADSPLEETIQRVYQRIDQAGLDDNLFQKLINKKDPAAIYVWAAKEKRKWIDTLPDTDDKVSKRRSAAQKILDEYLLKSEFDWSHNDPLCVFLLIEMLWMSKTGLEIIPHPQKERNAIRLSKRDWEEICVWCKNYLQFGEINIRSEVRFLNIVSLLHLKESNGIQEEIRKLPKYSEYGRGQWYLICNYEGIPITFTGTVTKMRDNRREGWLKASNENLELKNVYFRSNDLNGAKTPGQMIFDFYISVSFSGLQACPRKRCQ